MLAKSSPRESLTAHLAATLAGALTLQRRVGSIGLVERVTEGRFWPTVCLAALCHDAGKIADGFQDMLNGASRAWGERHEIVSLGFLPALLRDESLLRWVAAGVATHHRALEGGRKPLNVAYGHVPVEEWRGRLEPIPADVATELAQWLADTAGSAGMPVAPSCPRELDVVNEAWRVFGSLLDAWELPARPDEGLTAVLVQGAVTFSDHLSSAHGTLNTHQPFDAGFRPRLEGRFAEMGRRLRPHQTDAAARNGHLLLRAPTGSGKTEAGLLWAAAQVAAVGSATGGVPRIFFTLPYLASINAMAGRLNELLDDDALVGVMHSRAASYHLAEAICSEDGDDERVQAAAKAVSRAAATRLFRETVRVGTPYQLLRGVLAGPVHSGNLIDAANSVFVLDELHAYDARRLGYVLAMARLWERLGGRVAVLSATLTDMLADLFRGALDQAPHVVDASVDDAPLRHRLALRNRHLTDTDSIGEIIDRLAKLESVLVVANNVADAQHLYAELAPSVGGHDAYLLHSRFRRMDRSSLETAIGDRFGVGQPRVPGLVVATQVVEVSLDVDFDCLFTSAAPLEALLQRFGRVNRIASRPPADVVVHSAAIVPRRKGGEDFADGVYPRSPVQAGWEIMTRADGEVIDEAHARLWLNEVYQTAWGREWREDVLRHQQEFAEAFLGFAHPFISRDELTERFDELFDGTEAILAQDRDEYEAALTQAAGDVAAGKLLAERYLIPMPYWAAPLTSWERKLDLRIINADYDDRLGLGEIRGPATQAYQAGEVL